MRKNKTPVVITRKDKRLHKGLHALAFVATGGASSVVTATKAATNAGYNARTRKLARQYEESSAVETEETSLLALRAPERQAVLTDMDTEELTELLTMPSGKIYSYWRDGQKMTAAERLFYGAAKRELNQRNRP
jgi:hypothetical protein